MTKRIFGRLFRLLAAALATFATGVAEAVNKPLAVWNGDFTFGTDNARGGFYLDLNNGSATDNLTTFANGVITIGSGAAGGVQVSAQSTSTWKDMTVVVGYDLSGATISTTGANWPVLSSATTTRQAGDISGIVFANGGSTTANQFGFHWNGSESSGAGTAATGVSQQVPRDGLFYFADEFAEAVSTGGSCAYVDGVEARYASGYGSGGTGYFIKGMGIGGYYSTGSARNMPGAVISYIAVFAGTAGTHSGANGNADGIKYWSLTGMTSAETVADAGTITGGAAFGVNLNTSGMTATLSGATSAAAVFVQENATLTLTDGSSLTIGSGTGPLYIADGKTLTIDASGLTLADGDSVTLVSGKIFGTDLIAVKKPVVSGCKVVATVTESGITISCSANTVSFTSPFNGSTLSAPTTATAYDESAEQISFGNNAVFNQTIGDRTAIVVDIFGGSFTRLNGFLKTAENTAADARSKDVYLRLSGGTATRVSGVQDCTVWSYAGTTTTTGDAIVQIEDGATASYVYGAGGAGGYSGYQVVVNGSSGVVVKGGDVTGSIVGGWTSSHNLTPRVEHDTAVRVEKVLGTASATQGTDIPAGYVIGGSAYNCNGSSASNIGGNSSVVLSLAGKSGAFGRTIIGGSAQTGGGTSGNQTVAENSSVTITAANDVTFASPIVGGGAKLVSGDSGTVNVGGNSSVTISGGTYTGRIVAGGYAPNGGTANVAGTATLTLNGGVFAGATLDAGNATGAKTLVVGAGADVNLAGAIITGFDSVVLESGATAQVAAGQEGSVALGAGATLKIVIGVLEQAFGYTPDVTGEGSVQYWEYVEGDLTQVTDADRLDGNNLVAVEPPVWRVGEDASGNLDDEANWSTGATPDTDTPVIKIEVNGSNTLTINATRSYDYIYLVGSGTLTIVSDGANSLAAATRLVKNDAGTVEIRQDALDASSVPIEVNGGALVVNTTSTAVSAADIAGMSDGTLAVYVASGATFTRTATSTFSAATLAKLGEGTLAFANERNTITSGTVIKAGTLKATYGNNGSTTAAFGTGSITVEDGGALDVNCRYVTNQIYLAGDGPDGTGALVNNNTDMGNGTKYWKVSLTDDASWGGTRFIHFDYTCTINLNGHTFTKKGANSFPLRSTTITGPGKVVVEEGTFNTNYGDNNLSTVDFEVKAGATLSLAATSMSVKDFKCAGTISASACKITVNGAFTVGSAITLPKLEMANASSIVFSSASSALTVSGSLAFPTAEDSYVTIDVSGFTPPAEGATLINANYNEATMPDVSKFKVRGPGILSVDGAMLKVTPAAASVNGVNYATLEDALAATSADVPIIEVYSGTVDSDDYRNLGTVDGVTTYRRKNANVYYKSGKYWSSSTADVFQLANGTVTTAYDGDTVIIDDKSSGDIWVDATSPANASSFKVARDCVFKPGVDSAVLGGSTITVADGKTLTFQQATRDMTLGAMTLNVDSTGSGTGIVKIDNASGSVTVSGTISGTAPLVIESGKTLVASGQTISNPLKGSGTIVYHAALPPTSPVYDQSWTGTTWIRNMSVSDFNPNIYGNGIDSTVKLSVVQGHFANAVEQGVTLELDNNGGQYGMYVSDGYSRNNDYPNYKIVIGKLKGSGALWGGNNAGTVVMQVLDWTDFSGQVQLANKIVVFGPTLPAVGDFNTSAAIYVCEGAVVSIPSGKQWRADGGIFVKGELKTPGVSSSQICYDDTSHTIVNIGESGKLTITGNGQSQSYLSVDYSNIVGSGTIKFGGTAWYPLPSNSTLSTDLTVEVEMGNGLIVPPGGITIGSLAGTKNLRSDLESSQGGGATTRTLAIKQSKDTTWSGTFVEDDRISAVTVQPGDQTGGTLTLAGDQIAYNSDNSTKVNTNPLSVAAGASVKLTGTWVGDVSVAGEFGGTGTVSGGIALTNGSTFKVWDKSGLTATGALTSPGNGESTTIDVSGIEVGEQETVTLLTVGSGMRLQGMALSGCNTHMLFVSGQELQLVPVAAIAYYPSGDPVQYSSVDSALNLWSSTQNKDSYVKVIFGTTSYTAEELAAVGIMYDSSDATYRFVAAQIGAVSYGTLGRAIAAAVDGDTVTLLRNTAEANIDLDGKAITLVEGEYTFSGSLTGEGTLSMTAVPKAISSAMWAEGWEGVLWLKNCILTPSMYDPVVFGNANSTLRLTGCSGSLNTTYNSAGRISQTTLDLQDDGDVVAFSITEGFPVYGFTSFAKLTGTGTLAGNDSTRAQCYHFGDASGFSGSISISSSSSLRVRLGGDTSDTKSNDSNYRKIWVEQTQTLTIGGGKTWTAPGGFEINGTVNVASGGALANNSISGSGKISYAAVPSYQHTFGDWTGTVELPVFAADGTRLEYFGKSGSKIKLNGITSGYLYWENQTIQAELVLAGDVNITATSSKSYTFAALSGSGNFSVSKGTGNVGTPTGWTFTKIAVDYSGTIANNMDGRELAIGEIALASMPSVGDKILSTAGADGFSVGSVSVGGVAVPNISCSRNASGSDGDGIYVNAIATTAGTGSEAVTTIDADEDTTSFALTLDSEYSGKVIVPASVERLNITGPTIPSANLILKVAYTPDGGSETTAYYPGILALDASGNVSLKSDGTVTISEVAYAVQPELVAGTPISFASSAAQPAFAVKAIPGLWYQVLAATALNGAELAATTAVGTPVQATGTSVSPVAPAFPTEGNVLYYKIAVGTSQAAMAPTPQP